MNLKIISAGAGSGKTYRLTQEMVALLKSGVRASGIIATTFTTKAAAELQERVRVKLLEEGLVAEANDLTNALIGTVHGLGVKLLKRFAFIAGVSPEVDIIADEDQQILFNKSLATVLRPERIEEMEQYSNRLGLNKKEYYDWRREVKYLADAARANDFSVEVLEKSKHHSIESFKKFLGKVSKKSGETFANELLAFLETAITNLEANEDTTKVTQKGVNTLRGFQTALRLKGEINWHEWVKISKIKVGAKSKEDVVELIEFAKTHTTHPLFHRDIENYLNKIFDIAIEAIREYEAYKKQRGLIDYIDMEIQVKRLLDHPQVQEILSEELDLLMVDEFQDTNPIQLEIFLKLSRIAKHSIWVGDPKQSIYGFRGADPRLMQEIINQTGGVKPEDIQEFSWRSREDIVHLTNAIFTKTFSDLPKERVALKAKRTKVQNPDDANFEAEDMKVSDALIHWHFQYSGEGKRLPGKPWMENCVATGIATMLERKTLVSPKDEKKVRAVQPGDFAILCRSNAECQEMAEALHRVGLKAAIARTGLLNTAEAHLILACLKYILYRSDSLSVAEILLLAGDQNIEKIIDDRLDFLAREAQDLVQKKRELWAEENPFIKKLNELRPKVIELSSTEILNLVMEELDLRRIIASWGKMSQRMDNVDVLRRFALKYEEACNRLHTAASLGGFLLYLNELEAKDADEQGSGDGMDAVNVLTYHKSKGLEWPVVICSSLEGNLRDKVWGMNIVAETPEVNLDNILGNRWLRYWINPYSDQFRGTQLEERINASEEKKEAYQQALQEEARLLYVGITRARDYLVFPTREKPTKWLNRCWHEGQEDFPTLDVNSIETPWEWNNSPIVMDIEVRIFPRDFQETEPTETPILFLDKRAGQQDHLAYLITEPNKEFKKGKLKISHQKAIDLGPRLSLAEKNQSLYLAQTVQAFLRADDVQDSNLQRASMAELLMERYEADELIDAPTLLQVSDQFFSHLNKLFEIKKIHRQFPIHFHYQKRLFETEIDFLIETSSGLIVLQNNDVYGDLKQQKKQVFEKAPWFYLCKKALQSSFPNITIQTIIHFFLEGNLVEMEVIEKNAPVKKSLQQRLFE